MNRKANKPFIRWCILGAVGCGFMAAGDWLLGCIPLQETDTGLFNRAYYLSGSYGLWRPVLTVGLGAIGGFLYYFVVKALNADIDEKYRKTKSVQFLCGIFTVAIALTIRITEICSSNPFRKYRSSNRLALLQRITRSSNISSLLKIRRSLSTSMSIIASSAEPSHIHALYFANSILPPP